MCDVEGEALRLVWSGLGFLGQLGTHVETLLGVLLLRLAVDLLGLLVELVVIRWLWRGTVSLTSMVSVRLINRLWIGVAISVFNGLSFGLNALL